MENKDYKNYKGELHFQLPVGYNPGSTFTKDIELLKSNGCAEEVFLAKLAEKPYTWIGNVITIATAKIGDITVGQPARDGFLKSGSVSIPGAVLRMPLAETSTMLVEVHRRVWQNKVPKQEIMCKYCGKKAITDIDLNKLKLSPANEEKFASLPVGENIEYLIVDLIDGFSANPWLLDLKKDASFDYLKDKNFNRIILRIPTLGDAIKHETLATTDQLKFWRTLSMDCIVKIQAFDKETNAVVDEFPVDQIIFLSHKLFSTYLSAEDLREVRRVVREDLPTMPFDYLDTCPACKRETPYCMEATAFFSE